MYYYAMIDSNNIVTTTLPSESQITADTMIEITEEQYNSGNLIGMYYNAATNTFGEPTPSVLAELSSTQINHGEQWLSDILNGLQPQEMKVFPPTFTDIGYNAGERMYDCAYGANTYVMVGENGKIITSTDGETWTQRTSGVATHLRYVVYGNNKFVAAGDSGTILTSTDGITWTAVTGYTGDTVSLLYGDGVFLAMATATNTYEIYISTDGNTWTKQYTTSNTYCMTFVDFDPYYRKPQFVGVGKNGITIYGWNGGTQWGTSYAANDASFYSIAYGNSSYVACDDTKIYHSPDGLVWETIGEFRTSHLHDIYYHKGVFYIPCHNGYVLVSKNGYDWKYSRTPILNYVDFVRILNGKMITCSQFGDVTANSPYETKTLSEILESL